jgi:hypothetical protein
MQQYIWHIIPFLSLSMVALAIVFTLGIIWRVEMKLDWAYKVFFVSLVFLFLGKVIDFFTTAKAWMIAGQAVDLLFSIFLLSGIWMMRDLFRQIDGEK